MLKNGQYNPGPATISVWFIRVVLCFMALLTLSYSAVFSQRIRIDSLKMVGSGLRDTARIDNMILLSLLYSRQNIDSARKYAAMALHESERLRYSKGIVSSLNRNASLAGYGQRDFVLQEKISNDIISRFGDRINPQFIAESYLNRALAEFCQSKFEQCSRTCLQVLDIAKAIDDKKLKAEGLGFLGCVNFEQGDYSRSFDHLNESLAIFKEIGDSHNAAIILAKAGDLYALAGDQETALSIYLQSLKFKKDASLRWHVLEDLGDTYIRFEQADPSNFQHQKYTQSIKGLTVSKNFPAYQKLQQAQSEFDNKNYSNSLSMLKEILDDAKKRNEKNLVLRVLSDLTAYYLALRDYKSALDYARELLSQAAETKSRNYRRDGYKLMYQLHHQTHQVDSAYFYFRKYTLAKDSIDVLEFSQQLEVYKAISDTRKKETQIQLLNNSNIINLQKLQLQEQELQSTALSRNVLLAGVLTLFVLGFVLIRNVVLKKRNETSKREIAEKELIVHLLKGEKIKNELQRQATELEMQALRAQMNPHFIFNSLNSINRFILQNKKEDASDYLTKFAKLVRTILQNSRLEFISLKVELSNLELYLELERLRFNFHFEFQIEVADGLETEGIKVSPLVIQPFVENSIWHGLMHKEEKGNLKIGLTIEHEILICKITDDGVGRNKARQLKNSSRDDQPSMGMRITEDRIARVASKVKIDQHVIVTDLVLPDGASCGTEVVLKIPLIYD